MATEKKVTAIKNTPKHLLGIQNLSVLEAKEILNEAKSFIKLTKASAPSKDIALYKLTLIPPNDLWPFKLNRFCKLA